MNNIDKKIFYFLLNHNPKATAKIQGGQNNPNLVGNVEFYKLPNGTMVVADIDNLPKTQTNIFAFHIHEGQSCDDNFSQTGGHLNPNGAPHPAHQGDMPPLFSNNGSAWQAFFTDRFEIDDIIGKTVVIHENVDDFTSQPAGNSGQKIACGEIKKFKHW